jgi:hypothetical protein
MAFEEALFRRPLQVVKADLAGWLGNPGRRARSFLWPVIFATSGSFLSRVVRGAVVLREQVRPRPLLSLRCVKGADAVKRLPALGVRAACD